MKLSRRMDGVGASPSLAVSAEVRRLRAEGRDVVDFGVGELDFPAVAVAKVAVKAAVDADLSHYTPTPGTPELREAIAAWHHRHHGTGARPEDVVVGTGAKPLLFELLQALVNPDDEVVVQSPYWVSFPAQVALAGGRFVEAPGDASDGFVPRAEHVARALSPLTRVVVLNSPCNPTGAVMPGEEVEAVVRLCAERGVFLIFDEVYDQLVHEGRHVSPLVFKDLHPNGIACVGSCSKTFAMTGWRLGHAVAPGEPAKALARVQDHVTSCASSLSQAGALAAYRHADADVEEMRGRLAGRRAVALELLTRAEGIECAVPAGGFFVFPRIDLGTGPVDSSRLAVHLLRETGVAVVPGAAFGCEGHVRISYAVATSTLRRGLDLLCAEVARLRRDPSRLG